MSITVIPLASPCRVCECVCVCGAVNVHKTYNAPKFNVRRRALTKSPLTHTNAHIHASAYQMVCVCVCFIILVLSIEFNDTFNLYTPRHGCVCVCYSHVHASVASMRLIANRVNEGRGRPVRAAKQHRAHNNRTHRPDWFCTVRFSAFFLSHTRSVIFEIYRLLNGLLSHQHQC